MIVLACAVLTALITHFFLPECINGTPQGLFGPCLCPVAFSGDACELENCVNGYEDEGRCICENKWHGDFCNICNAIDQSKCKGPCLTGSNGDRDSYYGDVCQFYCFIEDPLRGNCTADGPKCSQDFAGANCSFACADCSTNQVCEEIGGRAQCVCADEYYNFPACDVTCQTPAICDGGVSCTETCSGHGDCTQGRCTCSDSNFYVGLQCEHMCPGDVFFNTPCSGHGDCKYDSTGAYCSCEAGWDVVDDCSCNSVESCGACAAGDESCIPRGACSAEARGCVCNTGYDPATNCDTCDDNYVSDGAGACIECLPGGDAPTCNGHGTCEYASGSSVCRCDPGWSGSACDQCAANYYPKTDNTDTTDHCVFFCEPKATCNNNPCALDGTCNCAYNFGGTNCTSCAETFYPPRGENQCTVQCKDEGTDSNCIYGSCNDFGECICDTGASGDQCEINCPTAVVGKTCSGHGECRYDASLSNYTDSTRIQTCQCDATYYGDSCNHQPPMFNDVPCAGNGKVSFSTDNTVCSDDADCSNGFFCSSPLNPYQTMINSETDCNVRDDECYDAINSADWTSFCLKLYKSTMPCPGTSGTCADCGVSSGVYLTCKGTLDPSSDPCRHHREQSSCILDDVCIFDEYSGACRSFQCTDITSPPPDSSCLFLHGKDRSAYLKCLLSYKLTNHETLPASPPVDVIDNAMYTAATQADVTGLQCRDHDFSYTFNNAKSYRLRCLNGPTTIISTPSVHRPPGCFVEQFDDGTITTRPDDFNPYVSEYRDCKRSGLVDSCGVSVDEIDYSRTYVRTYAHISEGPVFIQTNTGVVQIVNNVLLHGQTSRVLTNEYVLIEIERLTDGTMSLFVDNELVLNQPTNANTFNITISDDESSMYMYSESAHSRACAFGFDQIRGFTDLFVFTGQNVDCSEYDSSDKLAYCLLRTNAPECGSPLSDTPLSVSDVDSCFASLQPWSTCSYTCMEKVVSSTLCNSELECGSEFTTTDVFEYCNNRASFDESRVPLSIATNPSCMEGAACISELEAVDVTVLESFCDDYIKEEGTCTTLTCDCEGGFDGSRCEITCPLGNGKTCSGNGICDPPSNHPCTGADRCDSDILGTCKCSEGTGRACTVECQGCNFAPYNSRESQRGACNSEYGVCETLPPAMIFDWDKAIESGRAAEAVEFNRDGTLADDSEFKVMPVSDILKRVRQNNCSEALTDSTRVEKVHELKSSLKTQDLLDAMETHPVQKPYTFLYDSEPTGWSRGAPNEWTEISSCHPDMGFLDTGNTECLTITSKSQCKSVEACRWYTIPVSLDTVEDIMLNTYSFSTAPQEQDCVAYPIVKRVLQMQGRFNLDSLLRFYQDSPNWRLYSGSIITGIKLRSRETDPERTSVAGYTITITLSSETTVEDDGEMYPDPVYVIDAVRDVPNGDETSEVDLYVTIGPNEYTIPIFGDYSRTFLKGCLLSITGSERLCNTLQSGETTSDAVRWRASPLDDRIDLKVFMSFDKEMVFNGIYNGGSGICGLASELECPGTITELRIPCSGHGTCSRSSCQCTCDISQSKAGEPGTILNMKDFLDFSPYRGRGCEKTCPGYDGISMDSICSGRGVCNYRGNCQCLEQYRGDKCEYTCPVYIGSGEDDINDQICNNHGICEVSTLDLRLFEHPDTGIKNYPEVLPAVGDPVTEVVFTYENPVLADDSSPPTYEVQYTCIRVEAPSDDQDALLLECAVCKCDETNQNKFGSWSGGVCTECARSVWGPSCFQQCPDCGDYGVCEWGRTGSGKCLCGDTTFGGIVRHNRDDENDPDGLSTVYRRYVRDDTVYMTTHTVEDNTFMFKPGSNCKVCMDGYDGSTCSDKALPCLMMGTPLYLPSGNNVCECKNGMFDPLNRCCPYGWGVPTEIGTFALLTQGRSYSMADLLGGAGSESLKQRLCFPCPNTQVTVTPETELSLASSALTFSASVCDGVAPCVPDDYSMQCDCGVFTPGNCNSESIRELLEPCPAGMGWSCGGLCGNSVTCEICPGGKYSDSDEDHRLPCKTCPAGLYSEAGFSSCLTCPAGYQTRATQDGCDICPNGKYRLKTGVDCEDCPIGRTGVNMISPLKKTHVIKIKNWQNPSGVTITIPSPKYSTNLPNNRIIGEMNSTVEFEVYVEPTNVNDVYEYQNGIRIGEDFYDLSNMENEDGNIICKHGVGKCYHILNFRYGLSGKIAQQTLMNLFQPYFDFRQYDTLYEDFSELDRHRLYHMRFPDPLDVLICAECHLNYYLERDQEIYSETNNYFRSDNCTQCPSGKYKTDIDWMRTTLPQGIDGCIDCPSDTTIVPFDPVTGLGGGCTLSCAAGKFKIGDRCEFCNVGQYQNQVDQPSCQICPKGQYQNERGKTSGCKACAKGLFQDQTGQFGCDSCPNGKYQSQTGKDHCSWCHNCFNGKTYQCKDRGTQFGCFDACQDCLNRD